MARAVAFRVASLACHQWPLPRPVAGIVAAARSSGERDGDMMIIAMPRVWHRHHDCTLAAPSPNRAICTVGQQRLIK